MKPKPVLRRARYLGATSLILGFATALATGGCGGGAASVDDYCSSVCSCEPAASSACVSECASQTADERQQASAAGCSAPFSELLDCMAGSACSVAGASCTEEVSAYSSCLEGGQHVGAGGSGGAPGSGGAGGRGGAGGSGGSGGKGGAGGKGGSGGTTSHEREVCETVAKNTVQCCAPDNSYCAPDTEKDWFNFCLGWWDSCPGSFECQAKSGCNTDGCPGLGDPGC